MPISTVCRLLVGLMSIYFTLPAFSQTTLSDSIQRDTTFRRIAEDERKRLIDPVTGTVPYERLDEARRQLTERRGQGQTNASIPNVTWQERGPSNAGGRTYTLLFDPNDPTHKKVWVGNLQSGLWYTNDITDNNAGWTPVSEVWENRIVTALAADPVNPQIMYAGTGDRYNYISGGGIWKTTNGGATWTRLSSTIPSGNSPAVQRALEFIQRIVVNSSGHVFAATQYGVVRSTDGGNSWSYALAPGQLIGISGKTSDYYNDYVSDLEIGSDGILYAAFNPSRVFKSTDASANVWQEITPPGGTGSERTELALYPSSSGTLQVLYAVSRAYNATNYYQDIHWFKKSTNGGVTWSDVTIPTLGSTSSDHFTGGNGYYALSLTVHPTDPNTVYAGGYTWCRSTNGGASWNTVPSPYAYHHGLYFQPGSNTSVALASTDGVRWSPDWGTNSIDNPTQSTRNNGYRAGEVGGVAMKAAPGSSFMLANVQPQGIVRLTSAGLSSSQLIASVSTSTSPNFLNVAFIDEDEPGLQLVSSFGTFYRVDDYIQTTLCRLSTYGSTIPADYDSQTNTLFTADYNFTTGQALLRKTTNVATTPTNTTVSLGNLASSVSTFLKLSNDRRALFLGNANKLYKITNLSQSMPTVTAIDNNAFPQYTSVSSIDVGATDNELLVTLSNYGIQSVWYTSNGGSSWIGKDQSNYGLPDIPVRQALFNPQNRKQVFLATELGIWSTTDVTALNPGWTFTSSGLGTPRVNQLRYRASDGLLVAATSGRGIWSSNALAIPYTAPAIAISNISSTSLCAGNTFTVSFTQSGPAMGANNTYEVWVSDANGSFTNKRRLGSGTASPITATLASGYDVLPYGINYRLKVIATSPDVESEQSDPLAIGNLSSADIIDRQGIYNSGSICPDSKALLKVVARNFNYATTSAETYQWLLDNTSIVGATSSTALVQAAGTYTVTLKQGGCTVVSNAYTLRTNNSLSPTVRYSASNAPRCEDSPVTLSSSYIGETATYQWKRNGVAIANAVSANLAVNQTGTYSYQIVDGSCSASSSTDYLQFGRSINVAISPAYLSDSVFYEGMRNYLYVNGYEPANTYQWYRNNVPLTGSNATQSYFYADQPGAYSVALKQGSCQTRSNSIVIRQSGPFPVSIRERAETRTACLGGGIPLTADPTNGTLQWQKDGVDIPGATEFYYLAKTSGLYTLRRTAGNQSAISAPVSLTFSNTFQPRIYLLESTAENCLGVPLYSGSGDSLNVFNYQWFRNGSPLSDSNPTSGTYFASQSGAYSLRITADGCVGQSKEIYVNIGRKGKPTLSLGQSATHLCPGNSMRISANFYDFRYGGTLQWKRNGIAIAEATSYQYFATESGQYSVVINQNGCEAESDPVQITIGEPTTARLSGNVLISAGKSAQLPVAFTGVAPWSFTLSNGQSVQNTYQNPYILAVTPASTTTYSLASVTNGCGSGSVSGSSTVSVANGSADLALNMMVNSRTPNVGDVVTYSLILTNEGVNDATGVQVASRLPTGLAFVDALSPGVTFSDGVVRADAGTVFTNGTTRIQFRVRVTQPGTFATAAQVTACQTPDPDSQPNSGTGDGEDDAATIDLRTSQPGPLLASANPEQTVLPKLAGNQPVASANSADLSLTMSTNALSPKVGDVITVTLQVSNRGGSTASSIEVQTLLPTSWQLASADGLIVNGQTIKGYINQLPAGKSATISLSLRVGSTNNVIRSQIADVAEPDPDSTPGNGYDKGEDDEASIMIRQR